MTKEPKSMVFRGNQTIVRDLNVVVTEKKMKSSPLRSGCMTSGPVGAAGGIGKFAPGIDLMYSVSLRDGRVYIDVAVLVRSETKSAHDATSISARWRPPEGVKSGGGASIGPHDFVCDRENRMLWVDGQPFLSLGSTNVVLFAEAVGSLNMVGTDDINDDLGAASSDNSGIDLQSSEGDATYALLGCGPGFLEQLTKLLLQSSRVQEFMADNA